jgi:hypothetical protein
MPQIYRQDPAAQPKGLTLSQHEDLAQVLVIMSQQAKGIRSLLARATGARSRPSQAAIALVEAVGHLAETLLDAHDATFGPETDLLVRTRYVKGA